MTDPDKPIPGMLRIAIEHTPAPTDPKGADEFYKALGIFIVAWGRLEGHFVVCLMTLLNLPGGNELGEQLPMNFDRRATLWRKAFETMTPLQSFRENALAFLAEITDVAKDRNAIAHALWESFAPSEPASIGIVTIKAKNKTKNRLDIRRATIPTELLKEIGEKANGLNLALTPLSQFLTWYRSSLNPPPSDTRTI
jgi:hypothetical protein